MFSGRPTCREGHGQLCCARLRSLLHTDFQEWLSSKKCMLHRVLRAYSASQMGMRLTRLAAIVLPAPHEGHQP